MKLLFLDTETTGLPSGNRPSIYQTSDWPHVLQLSFVLFDSDQHAVISVFDNIISLPHDVLISPGSIEIHGITRETSDLHGIPILSALTALNNAIDHCDLIIGHNISFDKQVVIVEHIRSNLSSKFPSKPVYCTMKSSKTLCNLHYFNKNNTCIPKFPKLSELYQHLFYSPPTNLHNSLNDVLICMRCYMKLVHDVDILYQSNSFIDLFIKNFDSTLDLLTIY